MHGRWTETQAMTLCQLFYNLFLESGYVGQAYLLSRVLRFGIPGVCHYTQVFSRSSCYPSEFSS